MMEEGYETIYYLQANNGKKKFAVVKFSPNIVRYLNFKAIRSGNFQFVLSDEECLDRVVEQLKEKLKIVIRDKNRRTAILNAVYDVLAEVFIDGLTFELTVEEALYLANLIVRHVNEGHDIVRETRNNILFEEKYRREDFDPAFG